MANEKYTQAILASYTIFRELYKSRKYRSPYQILSEYIQDIVLTQHVDGFVAETMKTRLKSSFGFELPTSVICTAINSLSYINLNNGKFYVNFDEVIANSQFEGYQTKASTDTKAIENALICYARQTSPDIHIDEDGLIQELVFFCVNESRNQKYHEIASKFVMSCEADSNLKNSLNSVLEGGILFSGLTYNITEYGSMTSDLTIFLDTEILFDIAGYNGTLYKSLAEDFLNIVKDENFRTQRIKLRYFTNNKTEIENFFIKAEKIMEGIVKEPLPRQAMCSVLDGCRDSADIAEKKVKFYQLLKKTYHILEDNKNFYDSPEDNDYNLEGTDLSIINFGNISETTTIEEGLKYCSHINKLRKGKNYQDYLKCKYIFVTRTVMVLEVSAAITAMEKGDKLWCCGYALHLNNITNLLWNKLNKGFGSTAFPKNLDSICRARQVLSSYITQGVYEKYNQLKNEYDSGKIDIEHLKECIYTMREKKVRPEDLTIENIEDNLDFDDSYFDRKAEEIAQKDRLLEEREDKIKELNKDKQALFAKDSEKQRLIDKQEKQIDSLTETIILLKQAESARLKNEEKRKLVEENRLREEKHQAYLKQKKKTYVLRITFKIVIPLAIAVLIWCFCNGNTNTFLKWIEFGLTVLTFGIWWKTGVINDYKQYNTDDFDEQMDKRT